MNEAEYSDDKFQMCRKTLGDTTIVNELSSYMTNDNLADFTDQLIKYYDLDIIDSNDEDDDVDGEDDSEEDNESLNEASEDDIINITDYLKKYRGWDDLDDVDIKVIGDFITANPVDSAKMKINGYLYRIGCKTHDADELITDFNDALDKQE